MMKILLSLLLVPSAALARDVAFTRVVSLDRLEANLRAAGFNVISTSCLATRCRLRLADSEPKDPAPYIAAAPAPVDRAAQRAAIMAELSDLEDLLDAGTITAMQQRRLIKLHLRITRASKED